MARPVLGCHGVIGRADGGRADQGRGGAWYQLAADESRTWTVRKVSRKSGTLRSGKRLQSWNQLVSAVERRRRSGSGGRLHTGARMRSPATRASLTMPAWPISHAPLFPLAQSPSPSVTPKAVTHGSGARQFLRRGAWRASKWRAGC